LLSYAYRDMRLTKETLETCNRVIELAPTLDDGYVDKAWALRDLTGDLEAARSVLQQAPGNDTSTVTWGWIDQYSRERKWDDVIELCNTIPSDSPLAIDAALSRVRAIYHRDGIEAARPVIEEALATIAADLEASPENSSLHLYSALLYSYTGDDEAALRHAEIALELAAIDGAGYRTSFEESVARVYAGVGRKDQALDILERLLGSQYPGAVTVHELRHKADWDPLRDHPRFQALLEKYGQEGVVT